MRHRMKGSNRNFGKQPEKKMNITPKILRGGTRL